MHYEAEAVKIKKIKKVLIFSQKTTKKKLFLFQEMELSDIYIHTKRKVTKKLYKKKKISKNGFIGRFKNVTFKF